MSMVTSAEFERVKAPDEPKREFDADGSKNRCRIKRPSSTEGRLIIDLHPMRLLPNAVPMVLDERVLNNVPAELEQRGVKKEAWFMYMDRLRKAVQDHHVSIVGKFASVIFVVGIPYILLENDRLQKEVIKIVKDLNTLVLEEKGMYAKLQKSTLHIGYYHDEVHWLAIALNEDEVSALQHEEHVFLYDLINKKHIANDGIFRFFNNIGGTPQVI